MNNNNKLIVMTLVILSLAGSVYACGWFSYEDIEGTRSYYNIYDDLTGIEDSMLLISRYPFSVETKKNVYIPMEENING